MNTRLAKNDGLITLLDACEVRGRRVKDRSTTEDSWPVTLSPSAEVILYTRSCLRLIFDITTVTSREILNNK